MFHLQQPTLSLTLCKSFPPNNGQHTPSVLSVDSLLQRGRVPPSSPHPSIVARGLSLDDCLVGIRSLHFFSFMIQGQEFVHPGGASACENSQSWPCLSRQFPLSQSGLDLIVVRSAAITPYHFWHGGKSPRLPFECINRCHGNQLWVKVTRLETWAWEYQGDISNLPLVVCTVLSIERLDTTWQYAYSNHLPKQKQSVRRVTTVESDKHFS